MPPDTIALTPIRTRRLPRFRRASHEEQPAFRLTDRDRELLKVIYEYRFLTAEMIQDLAPSVELTPRQQEALVRLIAARRAKLTGTEGAEHPSVRTKRKILHRLMVLYHNGYLQRLKLSDHEPIVYALGNKGADELVLYHGIDRQKIDWTTKNRETGERYVRHGLMVSRFRHALELALRDLPEATLAFWEPNGAFAAAVEYDEATHTEGGMRTRRVKGTVIPDGSFALTYKSKTAHFFLEADRSTMSNARFLAKLKNYFHFYATQVRGKEHPSGMKGFAVLTITLSEERKENLRRIAKEVDPNGRGLNLWWFACEKSYQAKPQELVGTIWQTAADDTLRSMFG
jgi:Replication-relaxation